MTSDPDERLRAAKDRIAVILRGASGEIDPRLGALRLQSHQLVAVGRLLEILARYRGALLADAVGLGKTYVALAVAREHERPLVVCPAALRAMWQRAMGVAGASYPVISMEALSRGERPGLSPDVLLVDEAHHLRTPQTRRYEAVAGLARHARVLLMSATPMHNSRRDLDALLGLFAGSSVASWPDATVARLIVRRDAAATGQILPALDGPHSLCPAADDDCLDAILALPPAIPAADEGVAHALATMSLVHLWASSRAALVASVRKRRARAIALRDAVASGHMPTSSELAAWEYADNALQLAFPFCVSDAVSVDTAILSRHLDDYVDGAGQLVTRCREMPDPDVERVRLIRALRTRHPETRIVAFSQYAHTVTALGRLMREDPGIAVVTAEGGRIASGNITRAEVLAQFAGGAPRVADVERIDLLLTTDLLSEGIDLRGASVVVHLDLPWNPSRLEQRVGRARRMGSPHERIHVYAFVPPTAADRMLELRRRLSAKVAAANAVVGGVPDPLGARAGESASSVTAAESLRARLAPWIDPAARDHEAHVLVAAARSCIHGWLAVALVDGLPRLVCSSSAGISDDPAMCLGLVEQVGEPARVHADIAQAAMAELTGWIASRVAVSGFDDQALPRRAVLERLTQTVARSPRHRRSAMIAAAHRARGGLATMGGVGTERILAILARSPAGDEAWIQSLETFIETNAGATAPAINRPDIVALILLG